MGKERGVKFLNVKKNIQILGQMLLNFLLWLVPALIIFTFSVILIVILMMAAADIGGSGNKKDPFRKWPNGLIGSLGIAYLLSGLFLIFAYFYWDSLNFREPVYLFGLAVFCLILGLWGIRYDYKRLIKKCDINGHMVEYP